MIRACVFGGLLLVGCSQEAPPKEVPQTLPLGRVEAEISWPMFCHSKAEVKPVTPKTSLVTIHAQHGGLFMFTAPTWQIELAEKKCAEHAAKPSRIIGP